MPISDAQRAEIYEALDHMALKNAKQYEGLLRNSQEGKTVNIPGDSDKGIHQDDLRAAVLQYEASGRKHQAYQQAGQAYQGMEHLPVGEFGRILADCADGSLDAPPQGMAPGAASCEAAHTTLKDLTQASKKRTR